jgi:hypothetical protein
VEIRHVALLPFTPCSEYLHHGHQLQEARRELSLKLVDNRRALKNIEQTRKVASEPITDIAVLRSLRRQSGQLRTTEKYLSILNTGHSEFDIRRGSGLVDCYPGAWEFVLPIFLYHQAGRLANSAQTPAPVSSDPPVILNRRRACGEASSLRAEPANVA